VSSGADPEATAFRGDSPVAVDAPVTSAAGIPIPVVALPEEVSPGLAERLGLPGQFPFTRGVRAGMYRSRPWTIRQLAGFGTARHTNERYRLLLDNGATAINGVFDYPSLRAFSSDDPRAGSDAGRGGVAVDTRGDFDELFAEIPLDRVSVSLVSSQPIGAVPHLAMFVRSAELRGFARPSLAGTTQNDFLMETAITIAPAALRPRDSFRLSCDLAEFCVREMPRWNPVSVSGYNYREAGADALLEAALALSHGQAIAIELLGRGLAPTDFMRRITFFMNAHSDLLEEVAKYRACRRFWARWVRDGLGIADGPAQQFRFHVQTSGVSNTARYAHVNIARSALQALAAVMGGAQSLHINGYDEALCVPTETAALTALRTQFVLLHETGVARSADPLGGSYLLEQLTDEFEERVGALVAEIDAMGGVVAATERGWTHAELARHAFEDAQELERGSRLVVGLNLEVGDDDQQIELFELPEDTVAQQSERIREVRKRRDPVRADDALDRLSQVCLSGANVMPAVLEAVDADVTLGEFGDCFRDALGTWQFPLW
jgi:methylmalonyl-CoA mutase N-terminal domain/subunit